MLASSSDWGRGEQKIFAFVLLGRDGDGGFAYESWLFREVFFCCIIRAHGPLGFSFAALYIDGKGCMYICRVPLENGKICKTDKGRLLEVKQWNLGVMMSTLSFSPCYKATTVMLLQHLCCVYRKLKL